MMYYTISAGQALKELGVSKNGLSVSEAEERLKIHGPNTIKIMGEPLWRKLIEPFADVFMIVLLVAAVISFWHSAILDGAIIVVIMMVSAIIYYVQRFSTERILRSLQKHDEHTIDVLRDNKSIEIAADQLVPGDVILLSEGEKVPADARLLEVDSLRVDESQLTGESLPISKQINKLAGDKEVYERSNMLFQGSFVISGEGIAVVVATGNNTEFGQLAALSTDAKSESPVQVKINRLLSYIIGVVAVFALIALALALLRGMTLTDSLSFVIALSVSAVPEGLPVAISVILVLGMRRMAAKKALVRNMAAIETIGVINTIATDKTGTLTKNELTAQVVWQLRHTKNFAEIISKTINRKAGKMHDPLDSAFYNYTKQQHVAESRHEPLSVFPFNHTTAMSGNLWHNGERYDLAVKGAPEVVIEHCDLDEGEREKLTIELHRLSADGYRVIAIAHQTLTRKLDDLDDLTKRDALHFDGFVGIADILHPEAEKAIQMATKAGVSVRMITGDHFETAYHIGKKLGMVKNRNQVFDSRRMTVMSDEELEAIIDQTKVFSRVIPEHKYRILALLKTHNITAMTGDGVNDVPALANANVGIAMGSGAGIAKDAGDIILLDDNFKSIVDAMREGRAIFANIRRMLFYLLSTNAGEILTMVGSLAIGLPVPLVPVQILWVNLVTDTAMVIPLGLEPGEKSYMTDKPKNPNAPILNKFMIIRMAIIALTMGILTLGMYIIYREYESDEYARTIAFNALVVMQWANAFSARSDHESILSRIRVMNRKFYIGFAIAVILQLLALLGPLGALLHVAPVAIDDLFITGTIAFIAPIILVEIHKFFGRRFRTKQAQLAITTTDIKG
jgi:Ca2+-transporting ATPase